MEKGSLCKVNVWAENDEIAKQVVDAISQKGLTITHNVSSARWGNHDGFHRYVVLDPKIQSNNTSIRSKACLFYQEARYSRNFLPSIKGEKHALLGLLTYLSEV